MRHTRRTASYSKGHQAASIRQLAHATPAGFVPSRCWRLTAELPGLYRGHDHEGAFAEYHEQDGAQRSGAMAYSYGGSPEGPVADRYPFAEHRAHRQPPTIMVNAYQIKRRVYDRHEHVPAPASARTEHGGASLSTYRADQKFPKEETKLLDLCLVLHAGPAAAATTRPLPAVCCQFRYGYLFGSHLGGHRQPEGLSMAAPTTKVVGCWAISWKV